MQKTLTNIKRTAYRSIQLIHTMSNQYRWTPSCYLKLLDLIVTSCFSFFKLKKCFSDNFCTKY